MPISVVLTNQIKLEGVVNKKLQAKVTMITIYYSEHTSLFLTNPTLSSIHSTKIAIKKLVNLLSVMVLNLH